MPSPGKLIFRKSALERLASPERTDARQRWPSYPVALAVAAVGLAALTAWFAAWLR